MLGQAASCGPDPGDAWNTGIRHGETGNENGKCAALRKIQLSRTKENLKECRARITLKGRRNQRAKSHKMVSSKRSEKEGEKRVLSTRATICLQEQNTDRNRKSLFTSPPIGLSSTHSSQDQL